MVARTEAELGPISILVNNAGTSLPATLEDYDPAAMARLRVTLRLTQQPAEMHLRACGCSFTLNNHVVDPCTRRYC